MAIDPPRRLPPLNALRAFEAAARHGGFAHAAQELAVTPGAVAQQVRKLEDWLGYALFDRVASGVRLTRQGAALAADLSGNFDGLFRSMRAAQGRAPRRRVSIAALPSVAQLWLGPRLGELRRRFPELSLDVTAMEAPPDPKRDLHELALFILTGQETPPGYSATALEADSITPVCTPALASTLETPEALADAALLHDTAWAGDWARWLEAAGVTRPPSGETAAFSLYAMAMEAALAGDGVLIGHLPLVRRHLDQHRLAQPFAHVEPTGRWLTLLRPRGAQDAVLDRLHDAIAASL